MKNIENEIVKWLFFAENNGKISWITNNVLKIDDLTRIHFDKEEKIISLFDISESPRIFDNVFSERNPVKSYGICITTTIVLLTSRTKKMR